MVPVHELAREVPSRSRSLPESNIEDFQIIDECEEWIVVNKPAPLMCHPSKPGDPPTLWEGLKSLLCYEIANGGQISILTRLDRETSGLTLVAKNASSARQLGKSMLRREIQKTYFCVVHGWPDWEETQVQQALLRACEVDPEEPIWVRQCVHPDGKPSETHFKVISRWKSESGERFSHLQATPLTGRMHQIRVHAQWMEFPLVGDKLYGVVPDAYLACASRQLTASQRQALILPRHALHAWKLQVSWEGESLEWVAPIPEEFHF